MGNPGKGHLGIFILFLQLFCKSQKKILKGETSPKNSSLGHFYTQENMNRIKNKMPRRKPSRRWAKPLREIQDLTEWRDIQCQ